jgi:MFS family permease
MWELFSLRSWIVAFLTYSDNLQPYSGFKISPTQLAFAIGLIGLPASITGNELARRYGRKKTITLIMTISALICALIGFTPSLPYGLVAALCIMHGVTVVGDSAALTAGAVAAAPAGSRGATLAMHSTFGFGAAFIGPLAVGMVLDFYSPQMSVAWGMAFVTMAAGCALGPVFLLLLDRNGAPNQKSRLNGQNSDTGKSVLP